MEGFSRRIFAKRVLTLFLIHNLMFTAFYLTVPTQLFLVIMNGLMLSVACGVSAAFMPGLLLAMGSEEPLSNSGFMLHGVVVAWASVTISGAWWYRYGIPDVPSEPLLVAYSKYMIVCAAVSHGLATGALKNGTPLRKWIIFGLGLSLVVLAGIFYGYRTGMAQS